MSLQQLKTIRQQRMKRIYVELQISKEQLKTCRQNLAQGKKKLKDFRIWRREHQETLFTQLQADYFSPSDLQNYLTKLTQLKEKEESLAAKISPLEKALDLAKKTLSQLKRTLADIHRDLEKVNEFIKIEEKEKQYSENKKEENTLDEFAVFKATKQ